MLATLERFDESGVSSALPSKSDFFFLLSFSLSSFEKSPNQRKANRCVGDEDDDIEPNNNLLVVAYRRLEKEYDGSRFRKTQIRIFKPRVIPLIGNLHIFFAVRKLVTFVGLWDEVNIS